MSQVVSRKFRPEYPLLHQNPVLATRQVLDYVLFRFHDVNPSWNPKKRKVTQYVRPFFFPFPHITQIRESSEGVSSKFSTTTFRKRNGEKEEDPTKFDTPNKISDFYIKEIIRVRTVLKSN